MAGFGSGTNGKENLGIAVLRHGGYSYLRTGNTPPCKSCLIGKAGECAKYDPEATKCELALEAQDAMIAKIVRLEWIRPEDMPLVEAYVKNWIFLFILDKWLSISGPFRQDAVEGLSMKGVLKQRWVCENAMSRLADQLGLSPRSRREMGLPLTEASELVRIASEAEERFRTKPAGIPADGNGKELDDSQVEA